MIRRLRFAASILLLSLLPVASAAAQDAAALLDAGVDRQVLYDSAASWRPRHRAAARLLLERVYAHPDGEAYTDTLAGNALHLTANILLDAMQDSLASAYYRRAIDLRDRLPESRARDRARSRINLASSLRYRALPDSADRVIREAFDLLEAESPVDSIVYLEALNELAVLAQSQEDYRVAYSATRRAAALVGQLPELDAYARYLTLYRAGRITLRLAESAEGLDYARRALAVAADGWQRADAHNLVALHLRELGRPEESFRELEAGVAAARAVGGPDVSLGHLYLNLADHYAERDDRAAFQRYADLAYEHFRAGNALYEFYKSDHVPRYLLEWDAPRAALNSLNERLTFLTGRPADRIHGAILDADTIDVVRVTDLLGVRAEAYTALDSVDAALRDYESLFHLQERLRGNVSAMESRSYLSRNLRPFFDRAVTQYYRRYVIAGDTEDLWRALEISERARAFSLVTALQSSRQQRSAADRQLVREIADLERRVSLGESGRRGDLEAARLRLDQLRGRHQADTAATTGLSRAALINHLRATERTLLEYHVYGEGSLLFVLTPDGTLEAYPIETSSALADAVGDFRQAIAEGYYRRKSLRPAEEQEAADRRFLAAGKRLTNQLLPEPLVKTLHLRPRLCIVPDGVLNYLPFDALPLTDGDVPLDYRTQTYLHDSTALSYAYSAQYLLMVEDGEAHEYATNLTAFAPTFSGAAPVAARRGADALLRGGGRLGNLPFNREEVDAITTIVPDSRAYYGAEADRGHFTDALGGSRILHLSSHGSVHPTDPNLSFVAFSQSGDSLQRDELLYFNDLYALPIDNELTVLSACETTLGKLAAGETTMSLASAFALAGARSTLTTLWEVDDRATKDLIVGFYRRLVDGASRADALHTAQTDLRRSEYAHPYYWSGITLYGAAGPLILAEGSFAMPTWGYMMTASMIVGIMAYFLIVLKRSTTTVPRRAH